MNCYEQVRILANFTGNVKIFHYFFNFNKFLNYPAPLNMTGLFGSRGDGIYRGRIKATDMPT